jgi:hypothetical protein
MIGSPELTGTAGSLIAVLDSFLVNGFADISVVDDSEEVIGEDVPVFTRQTA